MACNQMHLLRHVDKIIHLSDGKIEFMGTYQDCINSSSTLVAMLKEFGSAGTTEETAIQHGSGTSPELTLEKAQFPNAVVLPEEVGKVVSGGTTTANKEQAADGYTLGENKVQGGVPREVYAKVIKDVGPVLFFGNMLLLAFGYGCQAASDIVRSSQSTRAAKCLCTVHSPHPAP